MCCGVQAVVQGKWLVIEDLNLAPPEVLAALVPLLANRQLHLPQRAQVIKAAPSFQLLASITTAPGRLHRTPLGSIGLYKAPLGRSCNPKHDAAGALNAESMHCKVSATQWFMLLLDCMSSFVSRQNLGKNVWCNFPILLLR